METTFGDVNQTPERNDDVKDTSDSNTVSQGNSPFVWLLGPPGTGKRTQGAMITHHLNFVHISVPDLVVEESKAYSSRGEKVSMLLHSKSKFPEDIALTLLKESLAKKALKNNRPPAWLVSGYPRLLSEAYRFEREVGRCGLILYLWANPFLLDERIFKKNTASGAPTPPNLVYYLEKYHVRILSLLQTYADRLEFIDASQSQDKVFSDILKVLRPFVDNPPKNNLVTYETQWLNFKQRFDLVDQFLSKVPCYIPTSYNAHSSKEYIPHWWDVENSTSQIEIKSQKNEKNDSAGSVRKKSTLSVNIPKSPKVEKLPSQYSSRTVSSQEIRIQKKKTCKKSYTIKYQNKKTGLKISSVLRNHKSRKRDFSRRQIAYSVRVLVPKGWEEKTHSSQSLTSNKKSRDKVLVVNRVPRPSNMAARVMNVIHTDRNSPLSPVSESELQETDTSRNTEETQSLTKSPRLHIDKRNRDRVLSSSSLGINKLSRLERIRDNARNLRRVKKMSPLDIRRELTEDLGISQIKKIPSRTKHEGMGMNKRLKTPKSPSKHSGANFFSHGHDKDNWCSVKQIVSKHGEFLCASKLSSKELESSKSSSCKESDLGTFSNSFQVCNSYIPPNLSSKSDQPWENENVVANKSETKLVLNSVETEQSCDILTRNISVPLRDVLNESEESKTPETLKSISDIESKEQIVKYEPNISFVTFPTSGNVVNDLPTAKLIVKSVGAPKFIQISKSLSDTQKLNPINIQIVINRRKTQEIPIPVVKEKTLPTSIEGVLQELNSTEMKGSNEESSSHLCNKGNSGSIIDFESIILSTPEEVSTSSTKLVRKDLLAPLEMKTSTNTTEKHSSSNSDIIYDTNSDNEKQVLEKEHSVTQVQETPAISSSSETKSSLVSSENDVIRQFVSSFSDELKKDISLSKRQEKIIEDIESHIDNKIPSNIEDVVSTTKDQNQNANQKLESNASSTIFMVSNAGKKYKSVESPIKISTSSTDKKHVKNSNQSTSLSNTAIVSKLTKPRNDKSMGSISIEETYAFRHTNNSSSAKSKTLGVQNSQKSNKTTVTGNTTDKGDCMFLTRSKSTGKLISKKKVISEKDTGNNKISDLKQYSQAVIPNDNSFKTGYHEIISPRPDVETHKYDEQKTNHESYKKNKLSKGNFEFVERKNVQSHNNSKIVEQVTDSDNERGVISKLYCEENKIMDLMPSTKINKNASKITLSSEKRIPDSNSYTIAVGKSDNLRETNIQSQRTVKNREKTEECSPTKSEKVFTKKTISEKSGNIVKSVRLKLPSDEKTNTYTTSTTKTRKNLCDISYAESSRQKGSSKSDTSRKIDLAIAQGQSEHVQEKNIRPRRSVKAFEKVGPSFSDEDRSQTKRTGKVVSTKKITDERDNDFIEKENIGISSSRKTIKCASKVLDSHSSKRSHSMHTKSSKRVSSASIIKQSQSTERETAIAPSNLPMEVSAQHISATKSKSSGKLSSRKKPLEKKSKSKNVSRTNSSTKLHGDTQPSRKSIKKSYNDRDLDSSSENNVSSKKVIPETKMYNLESSEGNDAQRRSNRKEPVKSATSGIDATPSVSKSAGKISANKKTMKRGSIEKKTATTKLFSKTEVLHNVSSTKSSQSSSKVQDVEMRSDKNSSSGKIETPVNPRISESPKEKNLQANSVSKTTSKKKVISERRGSSKTLVDSTSFTKSECTNESIAKIFCRDILPTEDGLKTKAESVTKTSSRSKDELTMKGESRSKTESSLKVIQVNKKMSPRKIKSNVSASSTLDGSSAKLDAQQKTGPARRVTSATTKISVKRLPPAQRDVDTASVTLSSNRQPTEHCPTGTDKLVAKNGSRSIVKMRTPKNVEILTISDVSLEEDISAECENTAKSSDSDVSSSSRPEISFYYKLCSSIQQSPKDEIQQPTLQNQPLKARRSKCKPQWASELPDLDETAESKTSENSLINLNSDQSAHSSKSFCPVEVEQQCGLNRLSVVSDQSGLNCPDIQSQLDNSSETHLSVQTKSNLFCDSACNSSRESSAGTQRFSSPRFSSSSARARRNCKKSWTPFSSASSLSICGSPFTLDSARTSDSSLMRNRSSTSYVFFA